MATIKFGFDDKPTHIRFAKREGSRKAEVWIEQEGLKADSVQRYETLSYATLDELLDLQAELKKVIGEIVA